MGLLGRLTGGAVGGVVEPLADAYSRGIEQKEETRRHEIEAEWRREQAELDAQSRAIRRASTANGIKGLWRPILMLVLTFLTAWYFAQTFVSFVILFRAIQAGATWPTSDGTLDLVGRWVAVGSSLMLVLGAFGGVTSWSRGREKIAGRDFSPVGNMRRVADLIQRKRRPAAPEISQEPLQRRANGIERMPGIVVPGKTGVNEQSAHVTSTIIRPIYDWHWADASRRRLSRSHADLQRLFCWLLPRSPYDISIAETTRGADQQAANVAAGVSKTLDSRHLERPAMAVDFYLINPRTGKRMRGETKRELDRYVQVLNILKTGAAELGIDVTCGGLDWGWDYFHVELARGTYPRERRDRTHTQPDVALS